MHKKVTYYVILQHSQMLPIMLLIIPLDTNSMKFVIQHKIHAPEYTVQVHRPFSTTVQQITKDLTLFLLSEKLHYSTNTSKVTVISTSSLSFQHMVWM